MFVTTPSLYSHHARPCGRPRVPRQRRAMQLRGPVELSFLRARRAQLPRLGGVDGLQTYAPQLYPSTTTTLTLQRFAQYSATMIVEQSIDLDTGLLKYVHTQTAPEDPAFTQQLDHLRLQLHGIEPTEEWRDEITHLWSACTQEDSVKLGWICVLSAMMQDLDFVSY